MLFFVCITFGSFAVCFAGGVNIVVDIGNSTTKVGVFDGSDLKHLNRFDHQNQLMDHLVTLEGKVIVSSVKGPQAIPVSLANRANLILDYKTPLPVEVDYETPKTLGADRIAAAVGAYLLNRGRTNLVIDAGSAINYELVSAGGKYLGGGISPGLGMRYRALNNYTAGLPLVSQRETPEWIGKSTEACIASGVLNGIFFEVEGLIRHYREQYEDLIVTACGGDAELFESRLKEAIFVVPNLVLLGLNGILRYNEERN